MSALYSVLIVEDDPTLLRGLRDNFATRSFRVHSATDGESGLRSMLDLRPDLVVLDIMLPGLNGFEVCRRARKAQLDMPIIMLTARGQEHDVVRGLNLGADDYITKPFSIRELLARANAHVRRRTAKQASEFRCGELRIDRSSQRVFRAGAELLLTPKELKLLEFFVARAGRALTRDEILDAVWGGEVLVTARSVDRCVTTLRAKIEPDPQNPTYVRTLREVGYRFEVPDEDSPL